MSTEDAIRALENARTALDDAISSVEAIGEDRLERLATAHDDLVSLMGRYEERATGSGDFKAYLEFQESVVELVDGLDDDLPERDAFEAVSDRFEKRRLWESDFEAAREDLQPVTDLLARLDERDAARDRYREARKTVESRRSEIQEQIDRLTDVQALADADIDAPVEDLREPVESYNELVEEAFTSFKREAPAREVISFVETSRSFPLAAYPTPPTDLAEFLGRDPAGAEPIPTLLEYAEYSQSKLAHYVDSPQSFKRIVGGNRTYLTRLSAEPLTLDWPPAPAPELRWRGEELVSLVNRFAGDDVVERLERVLTIARDSDRFERLRTAARAREELTEDERERVAAGVVDDDLESLRAERARLDEALDEY